MDKWDTLMNTEDLQHKPLVLRTDDTFQRKHVKEPGKFWKKSLDRWNQGESEWWWEKYEVGEKHSHSQYTASPVSYGGFGLYVWLPVELLIETGGLLMCTELFSLLRLRKNLIRQQITTQNKLLKIHGFGFFCVKRSNPWVSQCKEMGYPSIRIQQSRFCILNSKQCRETHKQGTTAGDYSQSLTENIKRGNSTFGDVHHL